MNSLWVQNPLTHDVRLQTNTKEKIMAIGRLPTNRRCPKCGQTLWELRASNDLFLCLLLNPFFMALCNYHCPKCGRIAREDVEKSPEPNEQPKNGAAK